MSDAGAADRPFVAGIDPRVVERGKRTLGGSRGTTVIHARVPDGAEGRTVPGGKPTVAGLGIDVGALTWQRSGAGSAARSTDLPGAIEVAFAAAQGAPWVLIRLTGDPDRRVLVFDRHEWECFLDGAKGGEFDDSAI